MARHAVVGEFSVIEIGRQPTVGRMAIIAIIATRNVRRVFSAGYRAVMAGRASTNHLRVIHQIGGSEERRIVAVFANIGGRNMIEILTDRLSAIVTAKAVARNVGVIEICRHPGDRCMTVVAIVTTGNVCRVFSCSDGAVMARHASTDHLRVVNSHRRLPERRAMTIFAGICRLNVRKTLTGCFVAVVAIKTVADDRRVIKNSRQPGRRLVAVVACFTGDDVIRGFASGVQAVVARQARFGYGRVIHIRNRAPCRCHMTVRTKFRT